MTGVSGSEWKAAGREELRMSSKWNEVKAGPYITRKMDLDSVWWLTWKPRKGLK